MLVLVMDLVVVALSLTRCRGEMCYLSFTMLLFVAVN